MNKYLTYVLIGVFGFIFTKSHNFLIICFGLSIFIYAMKILETSFALMSGGKLEVFLKKTTDKRSKSFMFGLISTSIMQSSGLVSILAISFLSAELITLSSGLAIIYGANVGSTLTNWLIAGFGLKTDISQYAMFVVVFGVFLSLSKKDMTKGVGLFLLSVGLILLGITYMKSGFEALKDVVDFSKFAISGPLGVIVYTLFGIILTALMQSSTASLTILLAALSAGQIDYVNAVAFAIGSNLGSTIMAVLGSLNATIEGKKLMFGHLIFNATIVLIGMICIDPLIDFVNLSASFFGVASNDYILKIAFFHTYLNLIGVFIYYPLTDRVANLLNKVFKPDSKQRAGVDSAIYLNDSALKFIDSAREVLLKEMTHLYSNFSSIVAKSISISLNDIKSDLSETQIVEKRREPIKINFDELYDSRFKEIYSEIIAFIIKADRAQLETNDTTFFMDMRRANIYLAESAKDLKNIQPNFYKFLKSSNQFIVKEYDFLRENMIKFLRVMDEMMGLTQFNDFEQAYKKLSNLNKAFEGIFEKQTGTLLYENKISNKMATSLMNDSALFLRMTNSIEVAVRIIYNHMKLRAEQNSADVQK